MHFISTFEDDAEDSDVLSAVVDSTPPRSSLLFIWLNRAVDSLRQDIFGVLMSRQEIVNRSFDQPVILTLASLPLPVQTNFVTNLYIIHIY